MSETPRVSVVTAVYNGERWLAESLRSVLRQREVALEVVVVDDGSTDGSGRILAEMAAADDRVRIVRQENQGLTKALARGCREARGDLIARHDSDDISLPGRFARQVALLDREGSVTLAGCWARIIGPSGEVLEESRRPEGMSAPTEWKDHSSTGPLGHGSAMYRKKDYESVGGYREAFYWAQDVDLWLRLTEKGRVAFVPSVLYAYRLGGGCISLRYVAQQARLDRLAYACADVRRREGDESALLDEARRIRPGAPGVSLGASKWDGDYFVGKCLLDRRDRRAIGYLSRSLRRKPARPRAWAALALASLLCRDEGETMTA